MGECRVLCDGREAVFADLEALQDAVRTGDVGADCRVRLPGVDGWKRVDSVPELAAALGSLDPWAVWDAMEEAPADAATDEGAPAPTTDPLPSLPPEAIIAADGPVAPAIHELPSEAVQEVRTGKKKGGRFVIEGPRRKKRTETSTGRPSSASEPRGRLVSPPKVGSQPGAMAPTGAASGSLPRGFQGATASASPSIQTPDSSGGGPPSNVIAFPSPQGPSTLGPHALAPLSSEPLFDLPALQVPRAPEPRSGPRWGVLVLVALVAFGLVGTVNAWVRYVATQTYHPPVPTQTPAVAAAPVVAPVEDAPAEAVSGQPDASVVDELTALDQALRGRMRSEPGTVRKKGDLEAALYVDLSRMGLSELKVDAVVTAWGGKQRDIPQSAEVQVGFRSRPGELDRELAAVGLIVGRYIQAYELDMARFEVLLDAGESRVRRWPIDPAQARNYYIRRSDLPTFLTNMRSAGGR